MSSTGDFIRVGNDAFSVDALAKVDMFIPVDHWLIIKDGRVRDSKPTQIDMGGAVMYVRTKDDIACVHEKLPCFIRIGDVLYRPSCFTYIRKIIDISADNLLYGGVDFMICTDMYGHHIAFPRRTLYVNGKDEADVAIQAIQKAPREK